MFRRRRCGQLVELDELRRLCRVTGQAPFGPHAIPIAAIAGTVGRCCDFDRCFNVLRSHLRGRVRDVATVFAARQMPVIAVYMLNGLFYVSDGHKRIAAARRAGAEFIDADITELYAARDRCNTGKRW